jgi:hypothetical protein
MTFSLVSLLSLVLSLISHLFSLNIKYLGAPFTCGSSLKDASVQWAGPFASQHIRDQFLLRCCRAGAQPAHVPAGQRNAPFFGFVDIG